MTLKELRKQYFSDEYNVQEIFDRQKALSCLKGKSSPCWAAGKIKGTGWTKLASFSPVHKGDKMMVFVCEDSLVE